MIRVLANEDLDDTESDRWVLIVAEHGTGCAFGCFVSVPRAVPVLVNIILESPTQVNTYPAESVNFIITKDL